MMSMSKGDKVSSNTSQGPPTEPLRNVGPRGFQFAGQKFDASADDPYWIVQSEKMGAKAAPQKIVARRILKPVSKMNSGTALRPATSGLAKSDEVQ